MLKLKLQYFGHLMQRTDSLDVGERVKGRKVRGLQTEEIGYKGQTFFSLSLKWQEETNYKCQLFFFLLYTKLRRFLL